MAAHLMATLGRTSAATLLSCVHGRARREERDIERGDIKAAVRYGVRERASRGRWKFTFRGIIYIAADFKGRHEITSYVAPWRPPRAESVTADDERMHGLITQVLKQRPAVCTSHAVFVIDLSGSMREEDVDGGRETRAGAVFAALAEYVSKQMDDRKGLVTPLDVMTVIAFRDRAEVLIDREPLTNVLYNKLVDLPARAAPRSHGHYLPALDALVAALRVDKATPSCALALFFLSDGRPSDQILPGGIRAQARILQRVDELVEEFGQRLNAVFFGFGHPESRKTDFAMLEDMAQQGKGRLQSSTFEVGSSANALGTVLTLLESRLSQTRTSLTAVSLSAGRHVRSFVKVGNIMEKNTSAAILPGDYKSYLGEAFNDLLIHRFCWRNRDWVREEQTFINARAQKISIAKQPFGEGVERIVYNCFEINVDSNVVVGRPLVAKESKHEEDMDQLGWHTAFVKTQRLAESYAQGFNSLVDKCGRLRGLPKSARAMLKFIDAHVFVFYTGRKSYDRREVLVEEYLDGNYIKWNSNDGYVRGADTSREYMQRGVVAAEVMLMGLGRGQRAVGKPDDDDLYDEDDGDTDWTESSAEALSSQFKRNKSPSKATTQHERIVPEHYPQAFSHYSYRRSDRALLVCDIQGVLDRSGGPQGRALFRLTDPVVHYRRQNGRGGKKKQDLARTDKGMRGINAFFKTHRCNAVCRLIGLPDNAAVS